VIHPVLVAPPAHFSNWDPSRSPRIVNDVFSSTNVSFVFVSLPLPIPIQRTRPSEGRQEAWTHHARSLLLHRSRALCYLASFSRRYTTGRWYPHHHPTRVSRAVSQLCRTIRTNTRSRFAGGDAALGSLWGNQPQSGQYPILNGRDPTPTHFSTSFASETWSSRYSVPFTHITFNCHPSRPSYGAVRILS